MAPRWAEVTVPGRICLAGENLDWMIAGRSIVSTFDRMATVSFAVDERTKGITLAAAEPVFKSRRASFDRIASPKDELRLLDAVVRTVNNRVSALPNGVLRSKTDFPVAAGLSSSAAVSLAAAAALLAVSGRSVAQEEITEVAYFAECFELDTGAGWMDFLACSYGGLNIVSATTPPSRTQIAQDLPVKIVLVDTLQPRVTGDVLARRRARFYCGEPGIMRYCTETLAVVESLADHVTDPILDLPRIGSLVTLAHAYLRDLLGCSTPLIDMCVQRCLSAGALGAKLSGSGHGGCLFALVYPSDVDEVVASLRGLPVRAIVVQPSRWGLVVNTRSAPM